MKNIKLCFITVLLVAIGFLLPYLVATVQDNYVKQQVNRHELTKFEVAITSDDEGVFDALRLVSQYDNIIDLNNDKTKASSMEDAAIEELTFFANNGLDVLDDNTISSYLSYTAKSYLLTSEELNLAKTFWMIYYYDGDGNAITTVMLDEESMKIVAFSINNATNAFNEKIQEKFTETLAKYYGLEAICSNLSDESYNYFTGGEYFIQFYNESGEDVNTLFLYDEACCEFNFVVFF